MASNRNEELESRTLSIRSNNIVFQSSNVKLLISFFSRKRNFYISFRVPNAKFFFIHMPCCKIGRLINEQNNPKHKSWRKMGDDVIWFYFSKLLIFLFFFDSLLRNSGKMRYRWYYNVHIVLLHQNQLQNRSYTRYTVICVLGWKTLKLSFSNFLIVSQESSENSLITVTKRTKNCLKWKL